jgi:hypothetical protein
MPPKLVLFALHRGMEAVDARAFSPVNVRILPRLALHAAALSGRFGGWKHEGLPAGRRRVFLLGTLPIPVEAN